MTVPLTVKEMGQSVVDGIVLLVSHGFAEKDILRMPLDKFALYTESVGRVKRRERAEFVYDVAGAVGGSFSKDGPKKYIELITKDRDKDGQ